MRKIAILFILTVYGCDFIDEYQWRVDPFLQPAVDAFFNEAAARGIYIERNNLVATYGPPIPECQFDCYGVSMPEGSQRYIHIVVDSFYNAHPEALEALVFHELGHAVLYRPHTEPFVSIMAERFHLQTYEGKPEVRERFVDELFHYAR